MNKPAFHTNQTSGHLLFKAITENADKSPESDRKRLIASDLFIKCRSYSIINKIFFFISIFSFILVMSWPAIIFYNENIVRSSLFISALSQASLTSISALFALFYSHYKKRQAKTENILRSIAFDRKSIDLIIDETIDDMKHDTGISLPNKD